MPHITHNSRYISGLNVSGKTIKVLEENIKGYFHVLRTQNTNMKGKNNIKITFCLSRDITEIMRESQSGRRFTQQSTYLEHNPSNP